MVEHIPVHRDIWALFAEPKTVRCFFDTHFLLAFARQTIIYFFRALHSTFFVHAHFYLSIGKGVVLFFFRKVHMLCSSEKQREEYHKPDIFENTSHERMERHQKKKNRTLIEHSVRLDSIFYTLSRVIVILFESQKAP